MCETSAVLLMHQKIYIFLVKKKDYGLKMIGLTVENRGD